MVMPRPFPRGRTAPRPIVTVDTANAETNVVQDRAAGAILDAQNLPSAQERQIDGVVFAAGTARGVAHGLGRIPTAWWVVRRDGSSLVTESATPFDDRMIYLMSAGNVTVSIVVR